jgi:hypothetical protein
MYSLVAVLATRGGLAAGGGGTCKGCGRGLLHTKEKVKVGVLSCSGDDDEGGLLMGYLLKEKHRKSRRRRRRWSMVVVFRPIPDNLTGGEEAHGCEVGDAVAGVDAVTTNSGDGFVGGEMRWWSSKARCGGGCVHRWWKRDGRRTQSWM